MRLVGIRCWQVAAPTQPARPGEHSLLIWLELEGQGFGHSKALYFCAHNSSVGK